MRLQKYAWKNDDKEYSKDIVINKGKIEKRKKKASKEFK